MKMIVSIDAGTRMTRKSRDIRDIRRMSDSPKGVKRQPKVVESRQSQSEPMYCLATNHLKRSVVTRLDFSRHRINVDSPS